MTSYCLFDCDNCADREICLNSNSISYCKYCGEEVVGDREYCSKTCRESYINSIKKEVCRLKNINSKHFSSVRSLKIEEGEYLISNAIFK